MILAELARDGLHVTLQPNGLFTIDGRGCCWSAQEVATAWLRLRMWPYSITPDPEPARGPQRLCGGIRETYDAGATASGIDRAGNSPHFENAGGIGASVELTDSEADAERIPDQPRGAAPKDGPPIRPTESPGEQGQEERSAKQR